MKAIIQNFYIEKLNIFYLGIIFIKKYYSLPNKTDEKRCVKKSSMGFLSL